MKKKLLLKKRNAKQEAIPTRITNETVAEHRERILAGGRRFKYPMQYARHRLVITAAIITTVALVLAVAIGWWQLYFAQNTSTFFYRVTRVIPVAVATVDGQAVRYSDYLMYYNAPAHWLREKEQIDLTSPEGQRQNDYIKRESMNNAIASAYAHKLADELGITIKEERIDAIVEAERATATGKTTQETYDASILDTLGWTPSEYRQDKRNRLFIQDVSFAIDTDAKQTQEKAAELFKGGETSLEKVASTLGGDEATKPTVMTSGMVPTTNDDGGLAKAALGLKNGQVSGVIRTTAGDGYYFVKLIDKTETEVSYSYLHIPLTEFDQRLAALKKDGNIREHISLKETSQQRPDSDTQ